MGGKEESRRLGGEIDSRRPPSHTVLNMTGREQRGLIGSCICGMGSLPDPACTNISTPPLRLATEDSPLRQWVIRQLSIWMWGILSLPPIGMRKMSSFLRWGSEITPMIRCRSERKGEISILLSFSLKSSTSQVIIRIFVLHRNRISRDYLTVFGSHFLVNSPFCPLVYSELGPAFPHPFSLSLFFWSGVQAFSLPLTGRLLLLNVQSQAVEQSRGQHFPHFF